MSKSTFDIAREHGRQMYILGLEHAINIIEIQGEANGLKYLKDKLKQEQENLSREQKLGHRKRKGVS